MTKDERYLTYIRDSIDLIAGRTAAGKDAFLTDIYQQDAVLWRLQSRWPRLLRASLRRPEIDTR
jgi:hypothetical protein